MYAPTAGAAASRGGTCEGENQQDQPTGRDDLSDRVTSRSSMLGGQVRAKTEHHIGEQGAADGAGTLRGGVRGGFPGAQASTRSTTQSPVDDRDDRVEMRTRHRAEHEDQNGEPKHGCSAVFQQLQTDVGG